MTLTRWNPVHDMLSLHRELNRVMNQNVAQPKSEEAYDSAVWSPMVDIAENDEHFTIALDLPGIDKKDVKINFTENELTISGERKVATFENVARQYVERNYGKFFRRFTFTAQVNASNISAKYNDGVLTVTVPKAEEMKPKSIDIQ